jgi:predicted small metal-binding protein
MLYVIRCDCGTDMEAPSEDEVVDIGVVHAKEQHALTVTPEQIRPLVEAVNN